MLCRGGFPGGLDGVFVHLNSTLGLDDRAIIIPTAPTETTARRASATRARAWAIGTARPELRHADSRQHESNGRQQQVFLRMAQFVTGLIQGVFSKCIFSKFTTHNLPEKT